jgi:Ca-activated chloride channel family protein
MNTVFAAVANGFVMSVLLTATVCLALRLTHRVLNAATRYAIWWLALFLSLSLPLFYVPTGRTVAARASSSAAIINSVRPSIFESSPHSRPVPVKPAPMPILPIAIPTGLWIRLFSLVWAIGGLVMLGRLVVSIVALQTRRNSAKDAPAFLVTLLSQSLARCGTARQTRIAIVDRGASPMVAGPFRPCILIPARLLAALTPSELEQVCLHEAAHLARFDDCALLLQRFIEALFAIHPVVRWIARQIDLEREVACDDFVIAATGHARPYASCLAHVAELANGYTGSPVAAAAADESSHLFRRIDMILDDTRRTGIRVLKGRFTGSVLALVLLTWLAGRSPALLAFASAARPAPKTVAQLRPVALQGVVPWAAPEQLAQSRSPGRPPVVTQAETIRLAVTVTDPLNRFVTGLDRDSFRIYEDGAEQEISSLSGEDAQVALSVISDEAGNLMSIQQAVAWQEQKLKNLRETYKDSHPQIVAAQNRLQELLAEKDSLASMMSLAGIQPPGQGGLLNSLYASIVKARNDPETRRAIVIVFDARDKSIVWPEHELNEVIRTAHMPVYTIALQNPREATDQHAPDVEPATLLSLLTSATGGRQFKADKWLDVPGIEQKILIELQNQYTITYGVKHLAPSGTYHRTEVRLAVPRGLPQLTTHSIPGYY